MTFVVNMRKVESLTLSSLVVDTPYRVTNAGVLHFDIEVGDIVLCLRTIGPDLCLLNTRTCETGLFDGTKHTALAFEQAMDVESIVFFKDQ